MLVRFFLLGAFFWLTCFFPLSALETDQSFSYSWPVDEVLRNEDYFVVFHDGNENYTVRYETGEIFHFPFPEVNRRYWLKVPSSTPAGSIEVNITSTAGWSESHVLSWDLTTHRTIPPVQLNLTIVSGGYWIGNERFTFSIGNGMFNAVYDLSEQQNVGWLFNESFSISGSIDPDFIDSTFPKGTDFERFQTFKYSPTWVTMDGEYEWEEWRLGWDDGFTYDLSHTLKQGDQGTVYYTMGHELLADARIRNIRFVAEQLNSSSLETSASSKANVSLPTVVVFIPIVMVILRKTRHG